MVGWRGEAPLVPPYNKTGDGPDVLERPRAE